MGAFLIAGALPILAARGALPKVLRLLSTENENLRIAVKQMKQKVREYERMLYR